MLLLHPFYICWHLLISPRAHNTIIIILSQRSNQPAFLSFQYYVVARTLPPTHSASEQNQQKETTNQPASHQVSQSLQQPTSAPVISIWCVFSHHHISRIYILYSCRNFPRFLGLRHHWIEVGVGTRTKNVTVKQCVLGASRGEEFVQRRRPRVIIGFTAAAAPTGT